MSETSGSTSAQDRDYEEIRISLLEAAAKGDFKVSVDKELIGRRVIVNGEGDPDMPVSIIGGIDRSNGRIYIDDLWCGGLVDVPPAILWLATPVVQTINEVRDLQLERAADEFMTDLGKQNSPN